MLLPPVPCTLRDSSYRGSPHTYLQTEKAQQNASAGGHRDWMRTSLMAVTGCAPADIDHLAEEIQVAEHSPSSVSREIFWTFQSNLHPDVPKIITGSRFWNPSPSNSQSSLHHLTAGPKGGTWEEVWGLADVGSCQVVVPLASKPLGASEPPLPHQMASAVFHGICEDMIR